MRVANTFEIRNEKYKTLRQWIKEGRLPIPDIPGEEMWTNCFYQHTAVYWSFQQTHAATEEELAAAQKPFLDKQKEKRHLQYECRKQKLEEEKARKAWLEEEEKRCERRIKLCMQALQLPVVPCENPSGIVVFDLETTGLNIDGNDDILQFAAIDAEGNILLNSYIRPYIQYGSRFRPDASAINGITPAILQNAPELHTLIPQIRGIFASAKSIVTYNGTNFDLPLLQRYGIDLHNIPHVDVMNRFAPIYGDFIVEMGEYRYQSLETCAQYYGYSFKAHDALEDCKATLFCYTKMLHDSDSLLEQ